MISAFRYELRRLASLRSSRRIPTTAVLFAAACGMASALAVSAGAGLEFTVAVRLAAMLPVFIAAVLLGAASSGHEYRYGMRAVTLAIIPRRARLAVAKTVVITLLTAMTGALASLATAGLYSAGISWAYAGDDTLIPADAVPGSITAGVLPAAAATAAAGLLGLSLGWLLRWYKTAVTAGVTIVALAVPIAAGWLAALPGISPALDGAEAAIRSTPMLGGLLNPQVLTAWPKVSELSSSLHLAHFRPTPPTSLAATALLGAVAVVALLAGVLRWQRD